MADRITHDEAREMITRLAGMATVNHDYRDEYLGFMLRYLKQQESLTSAHPRQLEPKPRPDVHGLWLMVRGAEAPRAFVLEIISGVGEEGDRWYGPIVLRRGPPNELPEVPRG